MKEETVKALRDFLELFDAALAYSNDIYNKETLRKQIKKLQLALEDEL